jgi:hypothetical protein
MIDILNSLNQSNPISAILIIIVIIIPWSVGISYLLGSRIGKKSISDVRYLAISDQKLDQWLNKKHLVTIKRHIRNGDYKIFVDNMDVEKLINEISIVNKILSSIVDDVDVEIKLMKGK